MRCCASNANYRYTWIGQVVSEVGDHFNNVAVFSLVLGTTKSGLVVSGVMLSRAIPAMLVGPLAGVVLDRLDRKRVMIASDLVRAVVALCFILTVSRTDTWLVYVLSGLLMVASPFFTAGRASILPAIATRDELHTANSLTQTTQWTTLAIGTLLGGVSVAQFGYKWRSRATRSRFWSRRCAFRGCFCRAADSAPNARALPKPKWCGPGMNTSRACATCARIRSIFGIALVGVGWATGGGAAQILFSVFGELVFNRGPGGHRLHLVGRRNRPAVRRRGCLPTRPPHRVSRRTSAPSSICYVVHGGSYIVFSQMRSFGWALVFIGLSRAAVGVSSILNMSQLLRHVSDSFRGRVFSTNETMQWSVMMISMALAGIASQTWNPRTIGAIAGALSSTTAIFWGWANATGRLPEPPREGVEPEEVEVHGEPTV